MKTDLEVIRSLFERLEIEYTTKKQGELLVLSVRGSSKISFSFFLTGEMCSLYNEW